jgi:hypothetical protein
MPMMIEVHYLYTEDYIFFRENGVLPLSQKQKQNPALTQNLQFSLFGWEMVVCFLFLIKDEC